MATIANANLAMTLNLPGNKAKVDVTCDVCFSRLEMHLMENGLRFRLECKVWGEDLGWWLNPDDHLFSYSSIFFPDATPTRVERVTFSKSDISMRTFDEDLGTDEIYAELTLRNLEDGSMKKKRTNIIKHKF